MSWADFDGLGVVGGLSNIDSLRFGLPVARIIVRAGEADPVRAAELVDDLVLRLNPAVSIIRWPALLTPLGELLSQRGLAMVPADTLIYWGVDLNARIAFDDTSVSTLGDLPGLGPLVPAAVRETFSDYPSHYSASAVFLAAKVTAGYAQWAEHLAAQAPALTFVSHREGSITALAMCENLGDGATIEVALAGTVPRFRGTGAYRALIHGVMGRAAAAGRRRMVISTQASNTVVQSAWAGMGLRPFAAMTTVHARRARVHG